MSRREAAFMEKLILHSTSTAQWHALINEAQASSHITLSEELENYLVFLLMRFVSQTTLADSIVAIDFLHGINLKDKHSHHQLQHVGDKCLLFSGLFPGLAEKRLVRASYFVDIGQSAYGVLSAAPRTTQPDLFAALSAQFVSMMDILQATRDKTTIYNNPLFDVELWQDTGSQAAYQRLCNEEYVPLVANSSKCH